MTSTEFFHWDERDGDAECAYTAVAAAMTPPPLGPCVHCFPSRLRTTPLWRFYWLYGTLLQVVKAITAGLFMNAAQYDHTEYDPKKANDAGSNVYRLLRHVQPRE